MKSGPSSCIPCAHTSTSSAKRYIPTCTSMTKRSSHTSKRESVKQATRRVRYETLLDGVELASGVIVTVADGLLNVPGLKSTAALVNQIVVVAKVTRYPYASTLSLTWLFIGTIDRRGESTRLRRFS